MIEGHRHDDYALRDHTHAGGGGGGGAPALHASTHASAGTDPVTLAQSQITNLTTDLGLKAPLASPGLTGTPTSPTAAQNTNTTQIATTAYVIGQGNSTAATIAMNGTQAAGVSNLYARADHVHASDTSRAPLASPSLTGTPLSTTAAVDTNTTQIATTAFVVGQAAGTAPLKDATATIGTSLRYARQDHQHPRLFNFSRCTANTSAATTGTYVVPTGFPASISLSSGVAYQFRIVGWYQCAATTYQIRHRLQYPTLTASNAILTTYTSTTASGVGGSVTSLTAGNTTFASGVNPGTAATSFVFTLEGFLIPSAAGNFIYDFTPNAAGSSTIVGGTYMIVTEVG